MANKNIGDGLETTGHLGKKTSARLKPIELNVFTYTSDVFSKSSLCGAYFLILYRKKEKKKHKFKIKLRQIEGKLQNADA